MLNDFLKYIEKNRMIKEGERVLMAVSGGIDSMVMAHLFCRTGFRTGIAHCNFRLRGKESDDDEKLVRKFAAENDIPVFVKRFATKKYAEENSISIQMAARNLRYDWFTEIMHQHGYRKTALAHNLNDNIETLLINLTRGTGITGLTGMRAEGKGMIRPLLFATREMISRYCTAYGIVYREDRSNAETKYTRNKIRHLVIPVLKEINPAVETTLQETAERLRGTDDIVKAFISDLKKKVITEKDGDVILQLKTLQPCLANPGVLYEITEPYGMTSALLHDLENIIAGPSGGRILTASHRIIKNREELIISPLQANEDKPVIIKTLSSLRKIPFIRSAISVNYTLNLSIPSDKDTACLDYGMVKYPLVIRKWKAGDAFIPLGMKRRKKLSDYFTDRKFSVPEKERALIMESGGIIAWIIGERIDERFRVTENTKKVLVIKAQRMRGREGVRA